MSAAALERALATARTGIAALAVAVALLLLLRVPLIATFRGALVVLAALEILAFGWVLLERGARVRDWWTIAAKIAVLAGAYLALSG